MRQEKIKCQDAAKALGNNPVGDGFERTELAANPQNTMIPAENISERLIAAWRTLDINASEPNIFHHSWFLPHALKQFSRGSNAELFTLWESEPENSKLIGIFPVLQQSHYGRWPLPHIQNWLHHNCFLGTPLVAKGHETLFWKKFISHLDATARFPRFFHIDGISTSGPVYSALQEVCESQQRRCDLVHIEERAMLRTEMEADAYYTATVRSKKRKELRRLRSRLDERGDVRFVQHRTLAGAALETWLDEFITLELSGWKGLNRSALGSSGDTESFFRSVVHGASREDRLYLIDLRLDGRPLAMLVNFIAPPGGFSFKTAFDEDYSRFSPGVLLQIENLSILKRLGLAWMDSCAAEGHPMIDSLWADRLTIGRVSIAVGGTMNQSYFGAVRLAETMRGRHRLGRNGNKIRDSRHT